MRAALIGVAILALVMAGMAGGARPAPKAPFPPPPANLKAYEVGRDYVKVSFGPSIVGPFTHDVPAPDGLSIVIRWGAAMDTLNPSGITYDFYRDGKLVWANRAQLFADVGLTLHTRSFSTCVVAHSVNGYGPRRCTTWTGVKQ